MATPRVAAAAATLLDAFGFLAPEQVVQLLLNTATDLGEPGVDSTNGHGVLNLTAALSAAGAGTIPDVPSDSGGGGGGGAGIAVVLVGGVAAFAMKNKKEELQKTILVDAYGRAFRFNFGDRIEVEDSRPSIFSLFGRQQSDSEYVTLEQTPNSYTQAFVSRHTVNPLTYTLNAEQQDVFISFMHRTKNSHTDYALTHNADLASDFGAAALVSSNDQRSNHHFSHSDLFSTPVLGYSTMGSSFSYGWNNDKLDHRLGLAVIDDQEENGHVSNSVLYESRVSRDDFHLGFQLGALVENGSLLGGASDGALGVDSTTTYYLGFNGSYNVNSKITLLGGYFQGDSSIKERRNGLLNGFSNIRTQGYAVGLLIDELISKNGSFGISYSSPLQTIDGSATLTLPVSQDYNTGEIGFESSNLSFRDGDKEKIIEAYYNYRLGNNNNVFAQMSYTKNPVSNLDLARDRTFYVGWKHQF